MYNYFRESQNDRSLNDTIIFIINYINKKFNLYINTDIIDIKKDKNMIYNSYSYEIKDSLYKLHPELIEQVSIDNNIDLDKISAGSTLKIKWTCSKKHTWECSVRNRTKKKTGCPYCCKQLISLEDSLLITHPTFISIFNDTKYKLHDLHEKSSKKISIKCKNNHVTINEVRNIIKANKCSICKVKLI